MTKPGLSARSLEISPEEIVAFLLRETAQGSRGPINTASILEYLRLTYLETDFTRDLSFSNFDIKSTPRALLSFPDRIVAVDSDLSPKRLRFSVLHEIGHYVLPEHQNALYVCDEIDLSATTNFKREAEANQIAASLIFKGNVFTLAANSSKPSAALVKRLATEFEASFEATVRRMVEKNLSPLLLAVFKRSNSVSAIDPSQPQQWSVRYCIASPAFSSRYFSGITGSPSEEIAAAVTAPGRDISDALQAEIAIGLPGGEAQEFFSEWFSNTYNIFALLMPK